MQQDEQILTPAEAAVLAELLRGVRSKKEQARIEALYRRRLSRKKAYRERQLSRRDRKRDKQLV